jgi:DNA-binding PadR family transcriptional regulator
MTRLGRNQVRLLGYLLGQYKNWREGYWPGDGWTWISPGQTRSILDSLVTRGLVIVTQAPSADGGPPYNRYQLTSTGRTEAEARFPAAREARLARETARAAGL